MKLQRLLALAAGIGLILATAECMCQASPARESRRSHALALEQQERLPEAEAAWQEIATANPGDGEAFAHLGLLRARQEHFPQAIVAYRKAVALNAKLPGLRLNLGLAYFKSGDMPSAIATLEPLLRSAPPESAEASRLTTLIGLAHYGAGQYPAAIPYLKTAIKADPQNQQFLLYLAQSCLWSKQYPCVLDTYREILSLNAESPEADMLAGEAYDEMKDEANALRQFEAAVQAGPNTPDAHFGYGYLLWRSLKFDEAEKQFRSELKVNPDHPLALTYLGDIQMRSSHLDEAAPLLQHAVHLQPTIALAHLDLGIIFAGQGRNEDAVRELKEAAKLSPGNPKVHWQLGKLYQSTGHAAEAKLELDKTRMLKESADQSLVRQLHQDQGAAPTTAPVK